MTLAMPSDVALTAPDAHVIAKQLIAAGKRLGKNVPVEVDLATAISQVQHNPNIGGAPSIVLTVLDPTWKLLDSGFFDPDEDGKLDPLQINYPDGSRYWWQLTTASVDSGTHMHTITMVPRVAANMMGKVGPLKSDRAKSTRAEFLKSLVVACGGEFYCHELKKVEPIATQSSAVSTKSSSKQPAGAAFKTKGVTDDAKLTCNGHALSATQKQVVNIALAEAEKQNAPTIVAQAMIYAAMGENNLSTDDTWQNSTGDSTEVEAHYWLAGGHGFQGGGGIQVAHDNPGYSVWQIANDVERNAVWNDHQGDSYAENAFNPSHGGVGQARALAEAAAIVQAGGFSGVSSGMGSDSVEQIQPYYFTVGTSDSPHESYWDASQRLTQEVNWVFAIDGDRVYYDSEMTLITQKPAAEVSRGDPSVVNWAYDWETRGIATNFALTLICEPFAFHGADVIKVNGMGAASTGSTAKLPGRWLLGTATRNKSDLTTTFQMIQPTKPKREPAPQVKTLTTTQGATPTSIAGITQGSGPKTVGALIAAAQYLSDFVKSNGVHYEYGGDRDATTPPSKTTGMDCSGSVGWCLYNAGFTNLPGDVHAVPASGSYEGWGDPGPGQEVTIWCSPDHIFIEFHPKGAPHMQGNTSYGSANGLSKGDGFQYFPWGDNGLYDATHGFTARHPPGT